MKLILPVVCFCVCGCITSGTELSQKDLDRIRFGETTYADVVVMVGEPQNQQQVANDSFYYSAKCGDRGDRIRYAQYMVTETTIVSGKYRSKMIVFDKDDVACDIVDQSGSASAF